MTNKQRIGILGGTFDPIHNGHLFIADFALKTMNLKKVVFIPTAKPPHKIEAESMDFKHRLYMVTLAVAGYNRFIVSTLENKKAYTVKTIQKIKTDFGKNAELFFICGYDSIVTLDTWYKPEELLQLCKFIVLKRIGSEDKKINTLKAKFGKLFLQQVILLDSPLMEISSSKIRERLKKNNLPAAMLPLAVEQYIYWNKLYANCNDRIKLN